VSGPGNRASKRSLRSVPTRSFDAEGHDASSEKRGLGDAYHPGSESSARSHMPHAGNRETSKGLDATMSGEYGREGACRKPQQSFEESDAAVVPQKSAKMRVTPVESMEGRASAKGKSGHGNARWAQDQERARTQVGRIGQRAAERKGEKFDNLLSAVKAPLLKEAYMRLKKHAASGVDGVTWAEYGERLDERLLDLQDRIHRGSYHPQPVRRVHIPKGDGRTRPLGIPTLEDKLVQQAVRMVLEPIYEREFVESSFGFRPGRSPHKALDALAVAIERQKVSWVLDADIRGFFDSIDHGWMQRFIEHRIGDRRLVRLLLKMLHAGVMEDGELHDVEEGTPQGGNISPLLANIFLHYALDLWVLQWRKRHARGEVYFVRYADDFVMGFQREGDARAMREALADRLAKFGLELHPDKTRVLQFGRFARQDRERDGSPRPETFDFLGFTHIAGVDRRGRFQLKRRTSRKKRAAKLAKLSEEMRRRRHHAVAQQHAWLSSVLRGHYRYYGVPTNAYAMASFRERVRRGWHCQLQRRSQRGRWTAAQKASHDRRYMLPSPRIHHPWPGRARDR
jgi:RNA-directed DNA polymerase